jgi:hydroxyacylglutathione hydrolase
VYHTPGHSRYDVSFYMESEGQEPILFSGDTVFYDGKISMLSTWDFNLTQVASSIERLTQLDVKMLLPGHGQLAMNHGSEHIQKAHRIFTNLGVPKNIG